MKLFEIDLFGFTIAPSFYGLMYVIGIFAGYYILKKRKFIDDERLDNLLFYIFLGILIGGRLGYVLFYNLPYYLGHFGEIFQIWKGGMSFHGGAIGVIIASMLFAYTNKVRFYKIIDEIAYVATIGIFFGRIGNYYNKELLGFRYDGPLSIEKDGIHYFPAPILEATLEGLFLFIILSYFYGNKKFEGQIGCLFLILYGFFRLGVELGFRSPDMHIGYLLGNMTLGGIMSIGMIVIGSFMYGYLWYEDKHTGKIEGEGKKKKK